MPPKLERVLTLRAFLGKADTLSLGSTKGGSQRIVVPTIDGTLSGPGIEAKILPSAGADWAQLDPSTGIVHMDVRFSARSDEGDMIYGSYRGILKMDPKVQKVLEWSPDAETTKSEDHYFFATPVFEVSSEKLKWMEQTVFISHGHFYVPGDGRQAVEYEVYKVVSA